MGGGLCSVGQGTVTRAGSPSSPPHRGLRRRQFASARALLLHGVSRAFDAGAGAGVVAFGLGIGGEAGFAARGDLGAAARFGHFAVSWARERQRDSQSSTMSLSVPGSANS